jgi:hypothetical protein
LFRAGHAEPALRSAAVVQAVQRQGGVQTAPGGDFAPIEGGDFLAKGVGTVRQADGLNLQPCRQGQQAEQTAPPPKPPVSKPAAKTARRAPFY